VILDAEISFTGALVVTNDFVAITAADDQREAYTPFTRIFQWVDEPPPKWWSHDVAWWAIATAYFGPEHEEFDDIVVMSQEGHVQYIGDHAPLNEKIPGSGVFSEGAQRWGYLSGLRQIGDHLYACGGAGQVYKRLGPNNWVHMDEGLLQDPKVEKRLLLSDINGTSESDIYVSASYPGTAGLEGRAFHFDGQQWRGFEMPEMGYLIAIFIEAPDRIWMCGQNGALVYGNAAAGFIDVSAVDDNQLFYSLTKFQNRIVLGSNMGLFQFDGQFITPLMTGLKPEPEREGDIHTVQTFDGMLWCIGSKDIVRYDGSKWERIHHPDNPKIGE
jgi:hypothetical protein